MDDDYGEEGELPGMRQPKRDLNKLMGGFYDNENVLDMPPNDEYETAGQPMDEFLAQAFGSELTGDSKMRVQSMKNTLGRGENLDEKDDLVDGLNTLTILSEGNKEKNVSQKADFDSVGKFTGIRGLSKEFKGLSSLVENEKDVGDKKAS